MMATVSRGASSRNLLTSDGGVVTVDNDFTGFADSLGQEIYNGDTLHVPHSGQDSATMRPDGYDYLVRWDAGAVAGKDGANG